MDLHELPRKYQVIETVVLSYMATKWMLTYLYVSIYSARTCR